MLGRIGARAIRFRGARYAQQTAVKVNVRALSSSKKSWVPSSDEKLQQITMKSLIHEVAEQQRELAQQVSSFLMFFF
jgi:hypothetical protein